jgi:dihydrofolate reductase
MKTQYYTAASLDGFIATSDDSLEWLFPLADINATSYSEFITQVGALAMGSATYAWLVRHVVKPSSTTPGVWPYHQPAWVFSRRELPSIAGADIRFVHGDVRPIHAHMRAAAQGKNLWLCRKFCSGGYEGAVAPVCVEIKQRGSRTVRPQ